MEKILEIILLFLKQNPENNIITTLSGWGQKPDFISKKIPELKECKVKNLDYLSFPSQELFLNSINNQKSDILIGWSLGGQIAIKLVEKKIIEPQLLILLSTPCDFLSPINGINPTIYQSFKDVAKKNPKKLLRKFHLMMLQGDTRFHELKRCVSYYDKNLEYWLDELIKFSAKDMDFTDFCKTELIYGKNDEIVNCQQAVEIKNLISGSNLIILPDRSHFYYSNNLTIG
jgi:pimeloyl-ACP methyl ester carboxylesterase